MGADRTETSLVGIVIPSRGEAFKRAATADYELTESELQLLAEVGALMDEIDGLAAAVAEDGITVTGSSGQPRVHPAVGELRQHRLALGRMLAQLSLPDEQGQAMPSLVTARAKAAAQARWADRG